MNEADVTSSIEATISLHKYLQKEAALLLKIADILAAAFQNGHKVVLFGNGGSAADAQHLATEFSGKLYHERKPLPAIAITTNTSTLTAIANDYGYDTIFSRQLEGLLNWGDVAIGISTSGNSDNVLLAIKEAKRLGATTIAFTGRGGKLGHLADIALKIPSVDTPRVQETHITAGHIICQLVEEKLFRTR